MVDYSDWFDKAVKVADRYIDLYEEITNRSFDDRQGLIMDLLAADGVNGNCAIDWNTLMACEEGTLVHDVAGIYRHLDRETGALTNYFLPRCAVVY